MGFRDRTKKGLLSVEIVVGIALAVVVLFIVLGEFSNNLVKLTESGGIRNLTQTNTTKTAYQKYNRDYSDSKVTVREVIN